MIDFNCETTSYPKLPSLTATVGDARHTWRQDLEISSKVSAGRATLVDSGGVYNYDAIMVSINSNSTTLTQAQENSIYAALENAVQQMDEMEERYQANKYDFGAANKKVDDALSRLEKWIASS